MHFHNAASAVAGVIRCGDEILLTVRAKNPEQGTLDLPGGFVDYGEPLEVALTREIEEELGLQVAGWKYLFSLPNRYCYAEVLYHTTDVLFELTLEQKPEIRVADDVAGVRWIKLSEIREEMMGLESIRKAIGILQQGG